MRELAGLELRRDRRPRWAPPPAVARQTLYEARLSLRQMDEGREMGCEAVTKALSDGDGRVTRRRDVRAHLRACAGCRRLRRGNRGSREHDLAALSPLPAVAAAGMLQGLLGGSRRPAAAAASRRRSAAARRRRSAPRPRSKASRRWRWSRRSEWARRIAAG